MSIYDLNNGAYLEHDIQSILDRIPNFYDIKFGHPDEYIPVTIVDNKLHHWASPACKEAFNKMIPQVKSLVKDMYATLENIFSANKGKFDKQTLEDKYPNLKEFRLANNKFKHYFDRKTKVGLLALTLMEPQGHLIDVMLLFDAAEPDSKNLRLAELIRVFLQILEDEKIINIDRSRVS